MRFRPKFLQPDAALAVVLAVVCSGISVARYRYYQAQRSSVETEIHNQLSAIADLKVQQIQAWRRERMADVRLLASEPLIAALPNAQIQFGLQSWLEAFRTHRGYAEVAVLGKAGDVRNRAAGHVAAPDGSLLPLIAAALRTGEVAVSDLHKEAAAIYLDFIAPVPSRDDLVIFLRVEASPFLYALVEAWPTSSRTAECLLVRKEGSNVRYLTDLRH